MKEKPLITSFAAAMTTDALITGYALSHHLAQEINPINGSSELSNQTLILKTGVTAVMIGVYALTAKDGNRWRFSTETAMNISNVLMWGVCAWNVGQVIFR